MEDGLASVLRGFCPNPSSALEKRQQLLRAGEPAEGDRAQLVAGGALGVVGGDEVGDPLEQGVDPHRVARRDAGDDVAQTLLVGLREGDVATAALGLGLGGMGGRVGLDDLGLGDGQHPAR